MPPKYKIQFTPLAIQDTAEITDYMAEVLNAPRAAYVKIDDALEPLEQYPFAFPLYKDAAFTKLGYRIRQVGSYLLFYVVYGNIVEIRRIIYAKRNLSELLAEDTK